MHVEEAIEETGPTYGRKMMKGYLAAKGIHAGERRVGAVLKSINRPYHEERREGAINVNPVPYHAEYMGHKIHLDQNEKLVKFGVTHVLAVDGYSGKIVAHATMPVKNNIIIYEAVYRHAVVTEGMWDQVRVDHGKEFYLTLYMQEKLAQFRHNQERQPYRQTPSTKNLTVERLWVEVNQRHNYAVKQALVQMENEDLLDMDDPLVKYCVSNLTCHISQIGMDRFVRAWNAHNIPGKGVPNQLAEGGCQRKITSDLLPNGDAAALMYYQDLGTTLTKTSVFGANPFSSDAERALAEEHFAEEFPDMSLLLNQIVNRNYVPFQLAILHLITTTQRFS